MLIHILYEIGIYTIQANWNNRVEVITNKRQA